MSTWSRRDALRSAAAAGALALAGCSGSASHADSVPRERGETVSDFEVTFVRDTGGAPVFSTEDARDPRVGGAEYVTGDDDLQDLAFSESGAGATLRSFVEATDLETESVYLLERAVGECYRVALVSVYREPDGIHADFCQSLGPADVDCSAETEDAVAIGIRLPFPGDDVTSRGSGWSSECEPRPTLAVEGAVDG